jgi:N,N-dimethylformamidase beta subunit-like, C-terminal
LRRDRPKVAFLASTASYMADADHGEHITARSAELQMNRLLPFGNADIYLYDHPELSGSLYDCHADDSGVCYSSRLRPVPNFSDRYHSWFGGHGSAVYQYNADTHLFDWLEHKNVACDVITDEDLHDEGFGLIKDYRVILTDTHPEYHSTAMWDAMRAWIDRDGRLMYMGGNGWYWRIAFHKTLPGVIECRCRLEIHRSPSRWLSREWPGQVASFLCPSICRCGSLEDAAPARQSTGVRAGKFQGPP